MSTSFHSLGYSDGTCALHDLNMPQNANCCSQPYGPALAHLTTGAIGIKTQLMTPFQMARFNAVKAGVIPQAKPMGLSLSLPGAVGIS